MSENLGKGFCGGLGEVWGRVFRLFPRISSTIVLYLPDHCHHATALCHFSTLCRSRVARALLVDYPAGSTSCSFFQHIPPQSLPPLTDWGTTPSCLQPRSYPKGTLHPTPPSPTGSSASPSPMLPGSAEPPSPSSVTRS